MKTKITRTLLICVLLLGTGIAKAQWSAGNSPYAEVNTAGGWTTLCGASSTTAIPSALITSITGLTTITPVSTVNNGALQITNPTSGWGNVQIGPQNGGYCHFITDRNDFYFNKPIIVTNTMGSYTGNDLYLQTGMVSGVGTTRMILKNSTGYVGIGTITPSEMLHVYGVDGNGCNAEFTNPSNKNSKASNIYFVEGTSVSDFSPLTQNNDNGIFWSDNNGGPNSSSGLMLAPLSGTGGVRITSAGYVGINTSTPGAALDIEGTNTIGLHVGTGVVTIGNVPSTPNEYSASNPTGYSLYVLGGILTEQVKVALSNTANWSDYVFGENYKLKSLGEVEQYMKENKHLPDVPSANDVKKDGINVGEMDATLLKKIEELTLYAIQQQKEIRELNAKLDDLEAQKH